MTLENHQSRLWTGSLMLENCWSRVYIGTSPLICQFFLWKRRNCPTLVIQVELQPESCLKCWNHGCTITMSFIKLNGEQQVVGDVLLDIPHLMFEPVCCMYISGFYRYNSKVMTFCITGPKAIFRNWLLVISRGYLSMKEGSLFCFVL